jgi:CheY-like chemotaxis protein
VRLTPPEAAPGPPPDRAARGRLRIVVADDAVLLREGLARLLAEDGHQVVAAVGDGPALVEAVLRHRPDVSVVAVRMPPTHTDEGLRAAITARSHLPGAPMLVLSQYVEASYAGDLLADGFADQPECLINPVAVTPSRAILAGSGGYFQHDHSPLLGGAGWAADRDSVKAASASAGRVSRTATSARSPASLA